MVSYIWYQKHKQQKNNKLNFIKIKKYLQWFISYVFLHAFISSSHTPREEYDYYCSSVEEKLMHIDFKWLAQGLTAKADGAILQTPEGYLAEMETAWMGKVGQPAWILGWN